MSEPYILAVDDVPDNLFLVQLALEEEGHEVRLVDNGYSALEQIEKEPPDLILLDVMMPEMDGYEVTRRIRTHPRLPYIPILLITAYEQPSLVEGLDVGADEFIRKPLQIDELQARVRSLLRLKQSIEQRENFVHCITHDLRTPLVAADRMLTLLQQGAFGAVTPEMNRAFETLSDSNQHQLKLLNNLLEAYSYDVGRKILSFIDFNLRDLLTEVVQELTPIAQHKALELTLDWDAETEVIVGDRLELRRVFANLISNGLKFTDRGGVTITARVESHRMIVAVQDTGVGIQLADQGQIFEPFRQGQNKRSGHGLGLYLCRQIVNVHRGQVMVRSTPGEGTTFRVELPLS
ncbi:MAG: hybrid sensor histidine kinase/response regulator [Spirulina sp. SIO3F2]|nr:hybrid sensor histidine kinase/response regulator [Spirulina sp. SIO3F2]